MITDASKGIGRAAAAEDGCSVIGVARYAAMFPRNVHEAYPAISLTGDQTREFRLGRLATGCRVMMVSATGFGSLRFFMIRHRSITA